MLNNPGFRTFNKNERWRKSSFRDVIECAARFSRAFQLILSPTQKQQYLSPKTCQECNSVDFEARLASTKRLLKTE